MRFLCLLWLLLFLPPQLSYPKTRVIETAEKYIGTKEGSAKHKEICGTAKIRTTDAWCAAFVWKILDEAKAKSPTIRSARARAYIEKGSISAKDVMKGRETIPEGWLIIWKNGDTWKGHIGFLKKQFDNKTFQTIEGNTSSGNAGSQRDGDGVYERIRQINPYSYFRIDKFTRVAE